MVQDSASRKLDQYIVRFPDGMRDRLKEAAAENKRSLNAEIIARLEASFEASGPDFTKPDLTVVLDASGVGIEMADIQEAVALLKERIGLSDREVKIQMQVNAKGLLFRDPTGAHADRFVAASGKEYAVKTKP